MIDINHSMCRFRRVPRPAVALLAGTLLLGATPAGAGWLGRGIGVAGVGHAVKETLDENTDIVSKMVSAVIDDDDETVSELMGEIKKTPGKLIKRAFPVLEAPQAVAEKLKSAKRKIERFVGGAGETLADARAALAVDRDRGDGGWGDAALLEGEPLPAPPETAFTATKYRYESPVEVLAALKGEAVRKSGAAGDKPAASSWDFDEWVVAKQEAKPHCYGVVDPETLPADCFGAEAVEEPAAANKTEDLPQAGGFDWASEDWSADTGWAGWDHSDHRYSDADREAARVGVFAADCWGVYGVSKHHGPASGLYELMRERMQRDECPNEETNQASSDSFENEYATALAAVLEGDSANPGAADYLAALNDLQAKEDAESERVRSAPKCDEYRAAIKQFFTTQGKYALAQYDGESFDRSSVDTAYRRLRSAAASVDVDFDSALSASQSIWYNEASGSSTAEARNKVWGAVDASRAAFVKHGGVCAS